MLVRLLLYALVIAGANCYLDWLCCDGKLACSTCPEHTMCAKRDIMCDLEEVIQKPLRALIFISFKNCCDAETFNPITHKNSDCEKLDSGNRPYCVGNTCKSPEERREICRTRCQYGQKVVFRYYYQ